MQAKAREFSGQVNDGHLPAGVRNAIAGLLRQSEGKRIVVSVREWRKKRSLKQNRFYWDVIVGAVVDMHRDFGQVISKDEAHEFLQREVLKRTRTIRGLDGRAHTVTLSSTELTTAEWEQNNEIIRAWAAGFGYVIPLPGEDGLQY